MMDVDIRKGLAGVVVDTTAVSKVNPETNSLLYRGYPVQQLAERCSFEEVGYLLWHGELPTAEQLADLCRTERAGRALQPEIRAVIDACAPTAHPMDVLRTAVSLAGANDPDVADDGREAELREVAATVRADAGDRRVRPAASPWPRCGGASRRPRLRRGTSSG